MKSSILTLSAIVILVSGLLAGCTKPAESTRNVGVDFQVETLFEIDGCKVYRFFDSGYKYFTNCKGTASWTESCGKGCVRDVQVSGGN